MGTLRQYHQVTCLILNVFDPRVPCRRGCKWVAPFGYLPTVGCPKHG